MKHSQTIKLHGYITILLAASVFECLFYLIFLEVLDNDGRNWTFLTFFHVLMECARNTFSRIFTLLVALGYQVVIKSVDKYQT